MSSEVRIEEDDGEYKVYFPYDEEAKEAMKVEFDAYWDPDEKCWVIDSSDYSEKEIENELKLHFPRAFR